MSTSEARASKPVRKSRARHRDVVFGCIDERLAMLETENARGDMGASAGISAHTGRLRELFDELRRSLNGEPRDGVE